jgi:diguanylate cyclase (GGDEF)-like protein
MLVWWHRAGASRRRDSDREPRDVPERPDRTQLSSLTPAEARGVTRIAARAGLVRIALAVLGLVASLFVTAFVPYRPAFALYFALALLFQWMIRRAVHTLTRAVVMGLVDTLFLSFLVQRMGSASSALPLVYVAIPVLYATTTPRRRLAVILCASGTVIYGLILALEVAGALPYAPAQPHLPAPDLSLRVATFLLVAICAWWTAVLSSQLIAALNGVNGRLRDLSQHDELTGLYNRRYVMQRLEEELARQRRSPGTMSVAMVDLDGFKRVNDQEGHEMGDAVLRAVATALLAATRKADVVARYGGDEFVVILPSTDAEGALHAGARIIDGARNAARAVCHAIPVSASVGTTLVRPDDDPSEIIRRVDEQLYAAKRAGGDRVVTS